jgi:aspartyl-tRNA(Asn)/glutamyl-tRNA(Gln) amidotransferase subunit C
VSLSRAEVEKVSKLARLELGESELDALTVQLAQIVQYVEQLSELDTDEIEPLAHTLELTNVFADDTPRPSLDRDQALANAPKHDGQCYRVPAVLGEEGSA